MLGKKYRSSQHAHHRRQMITRRVPCFEMSPADAKDVDDSMPIQFERFGDNKLGATECLL